MGFGRRLRTFARGIVAPTLFLSLTAYFCWQSTQGERGLQSYALRQTQLKMVVAELNRTENERDVMERRVAGLRTQRLDPDTLDERARAMLNVADPTDVVLMYGSGKRIF